MQSRLWQPPGARSEQEKQIVERIRRAKLFVLLRRHRHELFDESFRTANWRPSTGQASGGTRPLLPHNWLWRSSCKRTRAPPMTR
jgi:hypothetical protein